MTGRNGEHAHPDLDGLLQALVADVARLTAQVVALEADAADRKLAAPQSG